MVFRVEEWTRKEWEAISEEAHLVSFGVRRPSALDRVDKVFVLIDENDKLAGYTTVLEMDAETAYMQHGGIFPNYAKTHYPVIGFAKMIGRLREMYKRVSCKVENTNKVFLKICIQSDFVPVGTTVFDKKVYVDFLKEFGG